MEKALQTADSPVPTLGTVPLPVTTGTPKAIPWNHYGGHRPTNTASAFLSAGPVSEVGFSTSAVVSTCSVSSGLIVLQDTIYTRNPWKFSAGNRNLCKTRQPDVQICWLRVSPHKGGVIIKARIERMYKSGWVGCSHSRRFIYNSHRWTGTAGSLSRVIRNIPGILAGIA